MWLCFEGRGRVHGKLPEGELRQKGKSRVSAANPGRTAYGARGLRWLGVYGVVGGVETRPVWSAGSEIEAS